MSVQREPSSSAPPAPGSAMARPGVAAAAAALAATLGLAAASWVVAVRQMSGMDMGVATRLGSFAFFAARWVWMMAAMMLPGAAPAVLRRAQAGGVRAVPLFVVSYLAVWALVGVAVYALYRPHGPAAAGAVAIAAGVYELTPLKRHFRRRCRESVRSGFGFGLCCVGSSIGLMVLPAAARGRPICWDDKKETTNDQSQVRNTRRVACRPAGAARGREGADAAQRRTGAAAPGAALGPGRQAVPVRDRRGHGVPRRSVSGTLAAARLPLHVRARLHRRMPVLLGDRRRLRRLGRPPRPPRRHALRGVAGPACPAPGVPAADGLELPVGVFPRQRLQLRLRGGAHPAGVGS